MTYTLPKTIDEALSVLAGSETAILAGGTDIYPAATTRALPEEMMDISAVKELRGIKETDNEFKIGAMTTWSDIANAELPNQFICLQLAAKEVGSLQIQNAGTIAGNLCNASPAADGVPPLLALNARVEIASQGGLRQLDLSDFVLGNRRTALKSGELITSIIIPKDIGNCSSQFLKLGSRKYLVISIAMVAVVLEVDASKIITQARISVGSCSEVAQRITDLEQDLIGTFLQNQADVIKAEHFEKLSPITDIRATAQYRKNAAAELVKRALIKCAEAL